MPNKIKMLADLARQGLAKEVPSVSRLEMSFKDVNKRIPELTIAANLVKTGQMSAEEYARLVNALKPVTPYEFVPKPATKSEAIGALAGESKKKAYGETKKMEGGEPADLRLDIPAYTGHGVWVNSVHRKDAPTVYSSTSSVDKPTMIVPPEKVIKVATGETNKSPFAVIRGEWNPLTEAEAVKGAQKYLNNPDWIQVGMDPERHSYFYDRKTMAPVVGGDKAIQIGPLVLVKNPLYADPKDFKFSGGGKVSQDAMHMAVMNQKVQKKSAGGDIKRALELWNIAKGTRAKAAQEAAGLYHPIGGGVKLQTPVPFMEFKTIEDPTIKKAARKIISPEQLQGGIAIPLVGDRAAAGRILTDIGGQKLARPVTLEGGPEYMLTHTQDDPSKSAIWASGKGVISGLSKQAQFAGESGRPVYGVNVIGSPTNVDFNTMVTETLLQQFDPSSMTKKAKKEFTRELKNFAPDPKKPHNIPGKDFVGLDDVEAMRQQLLDPSRGELRKAFVNRMGTAKFRDMGFPDVAQARLAITEPSLVEEPLGGAGFTIGKLDPTGKVIEEPVREHATYPIALGGQYTGSLERLVPYKEFFPSFEEKRRLLGARPSSDYRAFSMSPVFQELNQEWLDTVMKSLGKDKPSVSEFKDGGVVHMKDGDLVEEAIREAKSKQEAPVNPFRIPTQKQSQYEKDFRQYLANQQAAREQVITELPQRLIRGAIPGAAGAAAGYAAQVPGAAGDIASLYQEVKPESWPNLPDVVQSLPTTERIQQYFFPEDKTSPEFQAGITGGNIAALGQGIASLPAAAKGVAKGATAGSKALANEAARYIFEASQGRGPLAGALAGIAPRPLITWHGSPHRFPPTEKNPLGEFDPSKIGTGEGAQAYGHGLYFAENPEVSKMYARKLKAPQINKPSSQMTPLEMALDDINYHNGNEELAISAWKDAAKKPETPAGKSTLEKLAEWNRGNVQKSMSSNLYKVDLPDEHIAKMLDWDKPLSQQPESVRKALAQIGITHDAKASSAYDDALLEALTGGSTNLPKPVSNPTGAEIYQKLNSKAGSTWLDPNMAASAQISEKLRALGIPGIRYLDGGSRAGGKGTSNFVVFPGGEDLMNIVGREKKGGVVHKAEGGITSDDLIVQETPL